MKLVIGATGFLGSRLTRQLVNSGEQIRVLVRQTSNTRAIDDLDVERAVGDLFDTDALTKAMSGCDVVFHCAVDARAWLSDTTPLFRTNVDGLGSVLDVAARADLRRFVFTSSIATIGRHPGHVVTESDAFNWDDNADDYIRSRVAGEELALRYACEGRVPVVAMCVANTYGPGDYLPTPHGSMVAGAALGKLPFTIKGMRTESVGIDDAAAALILAADKGRIGERYIISESQVGIDEVVSIAATTAGRRPPRLVLHKPTLYVIGAFGSLRNRLTGASPLLSVKTVRLMHYMSKMSHDKAVRELGWEPSPVREAIAEGARFWIDLSANGKATRSDD
ncbi:NAD-dependent epimerase/dehydratase family protein [Gordonia rhizosphera]|uniref:NAD-dependent epimerase/dehydratase family protein n=1 Tax=Gordonia rhizosphera NBRC 16068 TaxID=1108045 RepID=K6WGY7_9ACTN|nr:NAD-dependent epimerase/dehydratase family protein [Gordonia rhizosphera]GAB91417.1 NAD-dependent epimerase/dehydratase family protein [Gordonia rhizosphera NBRC 16068]